MFEKGSEGFGEMDCRVRNMGQKTSKQGDSKQERQLAEGSKGKRNESWRKEKEISKGIWIEPFLNGSCGN